MRLPLWYMTMNLLLLFASPLVAGQVIITMPDEQIQSALKQIGTWHHAWKDGTTYASDTTLGQVLADRIVELVSLGHYHSLMEVGGQIEIRYDQPRELIVP